MNAAMLRKLTEINRATKELTGNWLNGLDRDDRSLVESLAKFLYETAYPRMSWEGLPFMPVEKDRWYRLAWAMAAFADPATTKWLEPDEHVPSARAQDPRKR